MKRVKMLFILMIVCSSLFISVHGIGVIDQPGPRGISMYHIETTIVKP